MRFLGDMGISPKVIQRLREQGHDSVHLHDAGLDCLTDDQVLQKAREEQRILLTHDLDFGNLMSLSGESAPCVVLFRLPNMSAASVSAQLDAMIPDLSPRDAPFYAVVTHAGVRVRELPIRKEESG